MKYFNGFGDANEEISLMSFYNEERSHGSLNMLTPSGFILKYKYIKEAQRTDFFYEKYLDLRECPACLYLEFLI